MAIYLDPTYTYHKEKWRALMIPYIVGVGSAGSWADILAAGYDVVTDSLPSDVEHVTITADDGEPGGSGPLSLLYQKVQDSVRDAQISDTIRREEQRVAAGAPPTLDSSVLSALEPKQKGAGVVTNPETLEGELPESELEVGSLKTL